MQANSQKVQTVLSFIEKSSSVDRKLTWSKGFILAAIANILWGTSFLASKITLKFWDPYTASVLRFTIAVLVMLIVLPVLNKSIAIPKDWKVWSKVFLVGLSGFGFLYPFQLKGLNEIPSSLSACIMLTSPLFVLLLSTGIFKENLSRRKLIAIGIGIVGGTLLLNPASLSSSAWTNDSVSHFLKGIIFTGLASLSLALSVLATKSVAKDLDSYSVTFWSMIIGLLILLPFALSESTHFLPDENPIYAFAALLYLAVICSVAAFLIWNQSIAIAPPQSLASTMHLKTPVAVILGILIANEPVTLSIVLGTGLISCGVWLSQTKSK